MRPACRVAELGSLGVGMRHTLVTAFMLCLAATGCSTAIVSRGQHRAILSEGSSREQVRALIGQPLRTGVWASGDVAYPYDYWRIKGRVAPNDYALFAYHEGVWRSLGLVELFAFPAAAVMVPLDCRKEHDLWVYYRPDTWYWKHDTDSWPFVARSPDESGSTQPVAPHEPPPRASVSEAPGDRTLDSLPAPGPSGGR